jgi:hypothetical protein
VNRLYPTKRVSFSDAYRFGSAGIHSGADHNRHPVEKKGNFISFCIKSFKN